MHKKRLRDAISSLKENGCLIHSVTRLRDGLNSNAYKISTSRGDSALKLYPLGNDTEFRFKRETEYIEFLNNGGINKSPKLEESCPSEKWAKIQWINGTKPEILEEGDINQISDFINEIKEAEIKNTYGLDLLDAKESCFSVKCWKTMFENRFRLISKQERDTKDDSQKEAIDWLLKIIIPSTIKKIEALEEDEVRYSLFANVMIETIMSPSDVGIHNTIKDGQGNLWFIDFEYAGKDDVAKLVADWVLQPNNKLSRELEKELIQRLSRQVIVDQAKWLKRYAHIKELIRCKWCMIMLSNKRRQYTDMALERAKRYYAQ